MCEALPNSAAKVVCDDVTQKDGGKEEDDEVDEARGAEGGGQEDEKEETDGTKTEGKPVKSGVLSPSVDVKIADLGNACWVVSAAK